MTVRRVRPHNDNFAPRRIFLNRRNHRAKQPFAHTRPRLICQSHHHHRTSSSRSSAIFLRTVASTYLSDSESIRLKEGKPSPFRDFQPHFTHITSEASDQSLFPSLTTLFAPPAAAVHHPETGVATSL